MRIDESLQRILSQNESVIERFYQRFLNQHTDARKHFAAVDIKQQSVMLTMALMTIEGYFRYSYPATEHYLKVLGHRHHEMGVKPELYPKFRDCLLETLAEFHGGGWDEALADQWREAIDKATHTMLEGYERAYIY